MLGLFFIFRNISFRFLFAFRYYWFIHSFLRYILFLRLLFSWLFYRRLYWFGYLTFCIIHLLFSNLWFIFLLFLFRLFRFNFCFFCLAWFLRICIYCDLLFLSSFISASYFRIGFFYYLIDCGSLTSFDVAVFLLSVFTSSFLRTSSFKGTVGCFLIDETSNIIIKYNC